MGTCCAKKIIQKRELPKPAVRKERSISDETLQLLDKYLTQEIQSVDVSSKGQPNVQLLCARHIGQSRSRSNSDSAAYNNLETDPCNSKEAARVFHTSNFHFGKSRLQPLRCRCPEACKCERMSQHLRKHKICDSQLYINQYADVVCILCVYNEAICFHEFTCPEDGSTTRFTSKGDLEQSLSDAGKEGQFWSQFAKSLKLQFS